MRLLIESTLPNNLVSENPPEVIDQVAQDIFTQLTLERSAPGIIDPPHLEDRIDRLEFMVLVLGSQMRNLIYGLNERLSELENKEGTGL